MPLPAGEYIATIGTATVSKSESGSFIELQMLVSGEPHSSRLFLTERAMRFTVRRLMTLGYDPDKNDINEIVANPNIFSGIEASVTLEYVTSKNGNEYPRINLSLSRSVNREGSKLTTDELSDINRAFKSIKEKLGKTPDISPNETPF
jgi:hypothetical protein